MIKIKEMARTAKKADAQGVLPAVAHALVHDNVVPLTPSARCDVSHPPSAIAPRCNCYDYDDGDEYRQPLTPAQRLLDFVADLVAHGATVTIGSTKKSPSVVKTARRRAG